MNIVTIDSKLSNNEKKLDITNSWEQKFKSDKEKGLGRNYGK